MTYARGVCVCMCARENDGARVGFEKQVPACRVPRGRLDSEAATRWLGGRIHGERRVRLCESLSLLHQYSHPESACYPLAPALALALGLRERTNGCRAQARCCLSPPTENQYVGSPVLSPAKSQFLRSTSRRAVLFLTLVILGLVRHVRLTSCVNGS